MERRSNLFLKPNFGLNCLELVLGAVSLAGYVPWYSDFGSVFTKVFAVQFVFVVLTLLILILHATGVSMHRNLLLTCSILGSIVWLVTGVFLGWLYVLNAVFSPYNVLFISALPTVINGVVHVIDAAKLCKCRCCTDYDDDDNQQMMPADSKRFHTIVAPADDSVKY